MTRSGGFFIAHTWSHLRVAQVMNGGYPPLTKFCINLLHAEVFSSAARLKRGDDYENFENYMAFL